MVTVNGYTERISADGKKFYALILQGGMDLVLSEESGRYYATAKQASITSTFDEKTCQGLVGTKLPGKISKLVCEPFDFVVKETGEVITLRHRWAYNPNETAVDELVYQNEPIGVPIEL